MSNFFASNTSKRKVDVSVNRVGVIHTPTLIVFVHVATSNVEFYYYYYES